MTTEFNLPGSSFEEIQKILKGYSHASEQTSLQQMSRLTGLHETSISRNNKFLVDIGLILGGKTKSSTELGKKLGRALEHGQGLDAQTLWKEAVQTNEKVSGLITTLRIRGGMSESDFSSHVLYVSGQKNNPGNKTGARCVVDVLLAANLIQEENGRLLVSPAVPKEVPPDILQPASISEQSVVPQTVGGDGGNNPPALANVTQSSNLLPSIAINIQLHLPETENADVYEKLFKALREQLLSPIK
jgi:hypothetical protein